MPTPTSDQPANRTLEIYPNVPMEFVLIKPGSFIMGNAKDGYDLTGEQHEHLVHITKRFYLGRYAVSQAQWAGVMGRNPADFKGDDQRPVEGVSWGDIVVGGSDDDQASFLSRLQPPPGHHFRLPTEAEWEYAAKGGHLATQPDTLIPAATIYSTYAGGGDAQAAAWQDQNISYATIRSGYRQSNVLGLYGMSGNVFEWCQDTFSREVYQQRGAEATNPFREETLDGFRLRRGGSWFNLPRSCCPANRFHRHYGLRFRDCGFRLVLASSSGSEG